MTAQKKEQFSNRWGIILASLGMAIGAGNLWRFPRLAGQYGGTFILLWFLFLFVWSIPILLTEFAIGKKYKSGIVKSFFAIKKKYTWLGAFVSLVTMGIAFYYAVVTAWSGQYLWYSIKVLLNEQAATFSPEAYWESVSTGSHRTAIFFVISLLMAFGILKRGIQTGLEKANKILIPTLFVLLLFIAGRSFVSKDGLIGLKYLFTIDFSLFKNYKVWIEALSQSAWSTGAGWGLLLTISAYTKQKEDVALNTFIGGIGNNIASLLAASAIVPTVFALSANTEQALTFLQSGNQNLMFIIVPKMLLHLTGGSLLLLVFFLAFFLAAFSSFLPMAELFLLNITDLGIKRDRAVLIAFPLYLLMGLPSAYSLAFFSNQDWVWGIGLILSGLIFCVLSILYGPAQLKNHLIDPDSDVIIPKVYYVGAMYLNCALAVVLLFWWIGQEYEPWFNEQGRWNVFSVYSNATVVTQWAIALVLAVVGARFYTKAFDGAEP